MDGRVFRIGDRPRSFRPVAVRSPVCRAFNGCARKPCRYAQCLLVATPPWKRGERLADLAATVLPTYIANTALLMVLSASASYIVVPAVLRHAIPEANPSLYFGLSLGITFPLNILLGIPLYLAVAQWAQG
jgi:hypothetical protein